MLNALSFLRVMAVIKAVECLTKAKEEAGNQKTSI